MNEPVTSETYAAQLRRLAELTARVHEQRQEARTWYEQQCAAADRAVADSADEVNRAEREVVAARETQERVDAEVAVLWQELNARLGGGGRRAGTPPAPTPDATGDPVTLLEAVRDLLRRTRQPGELPGNVNPLLAVWGVTGAALAYALGVGARALGHRNDGDLAVGLPVLALVVTLLGPVVGLIPARVIADRRHAVLSPRPVLIVVAAGLTTTLLLLALPLP
ncbi:hypothetical protein SAMN05443287_104274 [Micromonospora phaseoli]|uniref:Uncharacterized protein n=1 Tax=Micromonospora phaseoli TaxID=1144548 RepID=A0A1H6YMX9_9ACTN|nr:hypothetical protein [Micromonospora phaseoli]PZW00246.1 hypothetical protein CLV64_103273 [Micromonospora phaseoli]GIJ81012.1 hypothetical protein Xph01_54440 [Micromonospora phaseoli]SEJ41726.1 hypothetical protein SAMN05443287_104274 [Micromonospora phaseoli]